VKSAIDIEGKDVDVGENIPSALGVDAYRNA
jgi:hypothetical protein